MIMDQSGLRRTTKNKDRNFLNECLANLQQSLISAICDGVHGGTHIIQNSENSHRLFLIYQVTHNLIIEEIYRLPLNSFLYILFL